MNDILARKQIIETRVKKGQRWLNDNYTPEQQTNCRSRPLDENEKPDGLCANCTYINKDRNPFCQAWFLLLKLNSEYEIIMKQMNI